MIPWLWCELVTVPQVRWKQKSSITLISFVKCSRPFDACQPKYTELILNIWVISKGINSKHFPLSLWLVALFPMHEIKSVISVILKTKCVHELPDSIIWTDHHFFQMLKWKKKNVLRLFLPLFIKSTFLGKHWKNIAAHSDSWNVFIQK